MNWLTAVLLTAGLFAGCSATRVQERHHSVLSPLSTSATNDSTTRPLDEQALDRLFIEAATHLLVGEIAESRTAIDQLLFAGRPNAGTYAILADIALASGDNASALLYAESALELQPRTLETNLLFAQVLANNGRLKAAKDLLLREGIQTLSAIERKLAGLYLVDLYESSGTPDEALNIIQSVIESGIEDPALYRRARILIHKTDDPLIFAPLLATLAKVDPAALEIRKMLVRSYVAAGDSTRMRASLDALLHDAPYDPDVVRLAETLTGGLSSSIKADRLGIPSHYTETSRPNSLPRPPSDKQELRRLAESVPPVSSRRTTRITDPATTGRTLYLLGRYGTAARRLMTAIDENPKDIQLWQLAAHSLLDSGKLSEALKLIEESMLLFPGNVGLTHLLVEALLETGKCVAARRQLDGLVAMQRRESPDSYQQPARQVYLRALTSECAGDYETVPVEREAAVLRSPSTCRDMALKVALFVAWNDTLSAQEMLREDTLCDGRPDHQLLLARSEYQASLKAVATQRLNELVADPPSPTGAYILLGDLQAEVGNRENARRIWLSAADLDPDHAVLQSRLEEVN